MSDTNDTPKSFDACGFMFRQVASITEWQDRALTYQTQAIEAERRAEELRIECDDYRKGLDDLLPAIEQGMKENEELQALNGSQGDVILAQSKTIDELRLQLEAARIERDDARKEAADLEAFNRDLQETIAATTVHTHVHTFDIENVLDLVKQLKQQGE